MDKERKISIIAMTATLLLFLSLIWTGYSVKLNKKLDAELSNEKLTGERLLSEKLELDKQIRDFRKEVTALTGRNVELDKFLKEANDKITSREQAIRRLTKENAAMIDLKKENESIRKIRDELTAQVQNLTSTNENLSVEVGSLKNRVTELKKENEILTARLSEKEVNRLVDNVAGNVRIETTKKRNQKLTVKSSRTNAIGVSFNMPEEYSGKVSAEFFRIVLQNPDGGSIQGKQQAVINTDVLKLNASNENTAPPVSRERVNIKFSPDSKLKEGIYTVIVYEGNHILGTAQVRLAI